MQTVTDDPPRRAPRPAVLDVEIVIPVYNEERTLAATIHRLHDFLSRQLPFSWQITIADNASTDCTPEIAEALAASLDGVEVLRLEQKGRGRALRAAWSASTRTRGRLHGRRSLDRPARSPAAAGSAPIGAQPGGDRIAPGHRLPGRPRRQA